MQKMWSPVTGDGSVGALFHGFKSCDRNKRDCTETFWKTKEQRKLRIHNITAKAALKFGSKAWVPKKRDEQHLEAAQMKFLRHLLGITKLNKEKNQCIRQKRERRTL